MKLVNIYKSDINRSINGVIKVAQDDEQSIEQELREYIITRELRKHFNTFFNNYEKSINSPTDKIGVWISGFFGSGKSHFLKILSYLLSNQVVAGKPAVKYFEDKFDDPMTFAQVERCASIPTDTILFNIDSKSSINKDKTAILRVFAKVFYEHRGFFGDDLKVVRLEQFIDKSGKMDLFKEKFKEVNGDRWENARDAFSFFEDDIVEVLISVLDMSETAARNWFNGTDSADLSIESLVREINEYVESKGKDYRLLFMIDEVGQYIGSDSDLMLNLQTIVEEIGTRCGGRVWVMVTSQEAIDSITKISGDDFSKIQGRFNTRLSLSSSSVDEVIKKRILAKTEDAENMLKLSYEKNSAILKNLFTFNDAVLDLKGYENEYEFVETYPFVPYQFKLMQNVLAQIRKHGNSGKHLSGGERSMLSGFQEAAQVVADKDENSLIPFHLFYNTVHTFLESAIRRVIDRCQKAADNGNGIEQQDVDLLKLLYLIRYVDDIKANVDNITTLMVDDIRADKINMRRGVQDSLDRLLSQNYIARNGDTYTFLTDDEQDIAREIKNTIVDSANIVNTIATIIFGDLYLNKKFKYGNNDFSYDQFIDETAIGQITNGIRLQVVTVASDLYDAPEQALIMKSSVERSAIILLSDETPYFEEIENSMKIRKYVKSRNIAQLPEAIQAIIRGRQQQASAHEQRAKEYIADAIVKAKVYIAGVAYDDKSGSVKAKFDNILRELVESVYTGLRQVTKNYFSDAEILDLLNNVHKQITLDGSVYVDNKEAVETVETFLKLQQEKMLTTSMGDIQRRYSGIPYGWREIDIAAIVSSLIILQKVTVKYGGCTIQPTDPKLPDYLRRRSEIDKTVISKRVVVDPLLLKQAREFLRSYFAIMDLPDDEDGLVDFVIKRFNEEKETFITLLKTEYAYGKYPGKSVVEQEIDLCDELLQQRKDNTSLLKKMISLKNDFFDIGEDMSDVNAFFKNQKAIYDRAVLMLEKMEAEKEYLQAERDAVAAIRDISAIVNMQSPYSKISQLPNLMQTVQNAYGRLLELKKQEVAADIQAAMAEVHQSAEIDQKEIVKNADDAFANKRTALNNSDNITALDAMKIQIGNLRQQYLQVLATPAEEKLDVIIVNRAIICHTAKLESAEDVEKYVAVVKERLLEKLEGHDMVHIV